MEVFLWAIHFAKIAFSMHNGRQEIELVKEYNLVHSVLQNIRVIAKVSNFGFFPSIMHLEGHFAKLPYPTKTMMV